MITYYKQSNSRRIVRCRKNVCPLCKHLLISNDGEHEDGGGILYCSYDGSDAELWLSCEKFEADEDNYTIFDNWSAKDWIAFMLQSIKRREQND